MKTKNKKLKKRETTMCANKKELFNQAGSNLYMYFQHW